VKWLFELYVINEKSVALCFSVAEELKALLIPFFKSTSNGILVNL
jgi:hypothetical protein